MVQLSLCVVMCNSDDLLFPDEIYDFCHHHDRAGAALAHSNGAKSSSCLNQSVHHAEGNNHYPLLTVCNPAIMIVSSLPFNFHRPDR